MARIGDVTVKVVVDSQQLKKFKAAVLKIKSAIDDLAETLTLMTEQQEEEERPDAQHTG